MAKKVWRKISEKNPFHFNSGWWSPKRKPIAEMKWKATAEGISSARQFSIHAVSIVLSSTKTNGVSLLSLWGWKLLIILVSLFKLLRWQLHCYDAGGSIIIFGRQSNKNRAVRFPEWMLNFLLFSVLFLRYTHNGMEFNEACFCLLAFQKQARDINMFLGDERRLCN